MDDRQIGTISNGRFAVAVHQNGVLAGCPDEGLTMAYGPWSMVAPGTQEFHGLRFDDSTGTHDLVIRGASPDWARRPEVVTTNFQQFADRTVTEAEYGTLRFRTEYFFDPSRDYSFTLAAGELNDQEREAHAGSASPDDVELDP